MAESGGPRNQKKSLGHFLFCRIKYAKGDGFLKGRICAGGQSQPGEPGKPPILTNVQDRGDTCKSRPALRGQKEIFLFSNQIK